MEQVRIIQRVPALVPEEPHQFPRIAPLDLVHHLLLDTFQTWVSQTKGDGDYGDLVRAKPFISKVARRMELDTAAVQFAVELLDELLYK